MIIGCVGFIGSGKDTVANKFAEAGAEKYAFASTLKDTVSAVFGWHRELLEGDSIESREFRETPDMFWSRKLGIPNFTPRLALQLIGTDVMRNHFHKDIWLNSLEYQLRSRANNRQVIISDARFRNELNLIKELNGIIIWVQRGELPEWYNTAVDANNGNVISNKVMQTKYRDVHQSEWDWAGFDVDFVIKNDGSLSDLDEQINQIQQYIQSKKLRAV